MLRSLGKTGLEIAPLVFGGNVLGTIDEKTSFQILDAFIDHGFNAIDTADVYSAWAPGNKGGESETIIGKWLKGRAGMRDKVTIFTKVGSDLGVPGKKGLSEKWILQAVDESLTRLGVGEIDLYFSHWPDPETSYQETLGAYDKLLKAGKVRAIGAEKGFYRLSARSASAERRYAQATRDFGRDEAEAEHWVTALMRKLREPRQADHRSDPSKIDDATSNRVFVEAELGSH
jgi:aryl-alcohol dehydrogenase-like predicted oxidoreductase